MQKLLKVIKDWLKTIEIMYCMFILRYVLSTACRLYFDRSITKRLLKTKLCRLGSCSCIFISQLMFNLYFALNVITYSDFIKVLFRFATLALLRMLRPDFQS